MEFSEIKNQVSIFFCETDAKLNTFISSAENKISDFNRTHPRLCTAALAVSGIALAAFKLFLKPFSFSLGLVAGTALGYFLPRQMENIGKSLKDYYSNSCGTGKVCLLVATALFAVLDPGIATGITLGSIAGVKLNQYFHTEVILAFRTD